MCPWVIKKASSERVKVRSSRVGVMRGNGSRIDRATGGRVDVPDIFLGEVRGEIIDKTAIECGWGGAVFEQGGSSRGIFKGERWMSNGCSDGVCRS